MRRIMAIIALASCCSAALAQTPIVVQSPDGRVVQCMPVGGIIKCY